MRAGKHQASRVADILSMLEYTPQLSLCAVRSCRRPLLAGTQASRHPGRHPPSGLERSIVRRRREEASICLPPTGPARTAAQARRQGKLRSDLADNGVEAGCMHLGNAGGSRCTLPGPA